MTIGVGGSSQQSELDQLTDMTAGAEPISTAEFEHRIRLAQTLMQERGLHAIYVHAGTNLYYFTGTRWYSSERMVGAIIPAQGAIQYIAPRFELDTLRGFMAVAGEVHCWEEHQSPYELFDRVLQDMGMGSVRIGLDEATPFFVSEGIRAAGPGRTLVNASPVTAACRQVKSAAELALMQRAKNMTLTVHRAAARILHPGITTGAVTAFINEAHRRVGATGSSFCIVLFGSDTAFPHGVKDPQPLGPGQMVLIDTGCLQHGYNSDITRTYVYGEPTDRQRRVWDVEKAAQAAGFAAARPGATCADVDRAARAVIEQAGFGPDYALPGLPHRTGHGIGLDIHEWPYLVRNDETPLQAGMCFSNEPMICVPGEFGVRHEDHFYMTDSGARWFTTPAHSVDDPFGYEA